MFKVILRSCQTVSLIENTREGKPSQRRYLASVVIEDERGDRMPQEVESHESLIDAIDTAIRFAIARLFPTGHRLRHVTLLSYKSESLPQPIEGEKDNFSRTAEVEMAIRVGGHVHTIKAQGTDTPTVVAEKLVELYAAHLAEGERPVHDVAATSAQ